MIHIKILNSSLEKINYDQIGKAYLQSDIAVRKAAGNNFEVTNDAATNEVTRLIKKVFAIRFKKVLLGTTRGANLEHNQNVGNVSLNMRV